MNLKKVYEFAVTTSPQPERRESESKCGGKAWDELVEDVDLMEGAYL